MKKFNLRIQYIKIKMRMPRNVLLIVAIVAIAILFSSDGVKGQMLDDHMERANIFFLTPEIRLQRD